MRFLIDADLPYATAALLASYGHVSIDVRDVALKADHDIGVRAKTEHLCLLTGDFGFADIRRYPPHEYSGLAVFEIPEHARRPQILELVRSLLEQPDIVAKLPGRLAIIEPGRIRLRGGSEGA